MDIQRYKMLEKIQCNACKKYFEISYICHDGNCRQCFGKNKRFGDNSKSDIIPIDMDLISNLRLRGLHSEADKMLLAFRNSIEQEKKQIVSEFYHKDRKIKAFIGKCINVNCGNIPIKGKKCCERCIKKRTEYYDRKWGKEKRIQDFFSRVFG